jgi:hypothetical protein
MEATQQTKGEATMKTRSIYISAMQAKLIRKHCGFLTIGLTLEANNMFDGPTAHRGTNRLAVSVWLVIANTLENRANFLNAQASDMVNLQWETGQSLSGAIFREMQIEVIAIQKTIRVIAKGLNLVGELSKYGDPHRHGLDNICSDQAGNVWFFTMPKGTEGNYSPIVPEWVGDWAFTK